MQQNLCLKLPIINKTQTKPNVKETRRVKLPLELQTNTILNKIKEFIQMLRPESGYFSTILYESEDKKYFLKKDQNFPFIPLDWTMYTMMRTFARTIVTSGLTLREEKHIYQEDRGIFGKEMLGQLYRDNVQNPFNLLVYTKKMSDEEITKIISKEYYNYIPLRQFIKVNNDGEGYSFKQIANVINSKLMGPTLYENGLTTLQQALSEVLPNEKNFVELCVLSLYHGKIDNKYIGHEFDTTILIRDFDKVWESDIVRAQLQNSKKQQEKEPFLKFFVYKRKQKNERKEVQN